ncbi:MAG: hypothetical protein QHH05_07095, partial [Syntrophomonadaceae bacterium]|nr:hypothetical protein [Syntrophomonadaceae bacterium]
LAVVALLVALLAYTPTRFFIKLTVLCGLPFLVIFAKWRQQRRFSPAWLGMGLCLALLLAVYGVQVFAFPERLQVKELTRQGDLLLAAGEYDQAIRTYRQMEPLAPEKAAEKVAVAEQQREYQRLYQRALVLLQQGEEAQARALLARIPRSARVYGRAQDLMEGMDQDGQRE